MYYIQKIIESIKGANMLVIVAVCVVCSCITVLIGAVYLIVGGILRIKKRVAKRKAERREVERKLKFTLPERENTFVQARVSTALNGEMQTVQTQTSEAIPLAHAFELLTALREKKLSTADGLTCAELASFLSLYKEKARWTNEESQDVNVALARVLKLTAKYSA